MILNIAYKQSKNSIIWYWIYSIYGIQYWLMTRRGNLISVAVAMMFVKNLKSTSMYTCVDIVDEKILMKYYWFAQHQPSIMFTKQCVRLFMLNAISIIPNMTSVMFWRFFIYNHIIIYFSIGIWNVLTLTKSRSRYDIWI